MIICGTGHRPKYMPCLYEESHEWAKEKKDLIRLNLLQDNPDLVISGMAIGWDTWLAEESLNLNIPVHAYIPFRGQGGKWPQKAKDRYQKILDKSQKVKYISESYNKMAFFKRDEAMVLESTLVYALLNPEVDSGGTFYTVKYAKSQNKRVINFWDMNIYDIEIAKAVPA